MNQLLLGTSGREGVKSPIWTQHGRLLDAGVLKQPGRQPTSGTDQLLWFAQHLEYHRKSRCGARRPTQRQVSGA